MAALAGWAAWPPALRCVVVPHDPYRLILPGQRQGPGSGKLIFKFVSEEEGASEWVQAEGTLASLLPVRDELIRGDLRALYLGWLLAAQQGDLDEQALEPPVPPSLGKLTGSLSSLVEFLRIDPDLLAVAAQTSPRHKSLRAVRGEMAAWVTSIPEKDKDDLLVRLMEGDEAHVGAELHSRFNRQRATFDSTAKPRQRTVGELLAVAKAQTERLRLQASQRAAAEKVEQQRLAAAARARHLDAVAERMSEITITISPEAHVRLKRCKARGESFNEPAKNAGELLEQLEPFVGRPLVEDAGMKRVQAGRQRRSKRPLLAHRLPSLPPC